MSYSDTSIYIHLIHNEKKALSDDTVKIIKNYETGDFEITFTDQNDGTPVVHKVYGLYRARVMDYLYMILKNQALDEEGYKSIQLTLPAMPRIIVAGEKLKDLYYREHFLEAVGTGLDLLDVTQNVKKVPSVRRYSYAAPQSQQYDWSSYETPVGRRSTAAGARPQHLYFDDE